MAAALLRLNRTSVVAIVAGHDALAEWGML